MFSNTCEYPSTAYSGLDKPMLDAVLEDERQARIHHLLLRTGPVGVQYRRKWRVIDVLASEHFDYLRDLWHELADQSLYNSDPMAYYGLSKTDFR